MNNSTNIKPLALNNIQAAGINAIYAVGAQGTLLQTTNGSDWKTLPTATATNFNAIQLNTTKGLIAGDKGYLSIITIPTVALTNIPLTTSNNLYDIALNTSNKAYIAGANGTLVSIPNITSPVPALASPQPAEDFRGICFKFGSNQIYAVGDNTAVYSYNRTQNGLSNTFNK